jgi:hypothetical protein
MVSNGGRFLARETDRGHRPLLPSPYQGGVLVEFCNVGIETFKTWGLNVDCQGEGGTLAINGVYFISDEGFVKGICTSTYTNA